MLVANWRDVLKHAWSIRCITLACILSGLEVALPFLGFLPIPHGLFALLSAGLTVAAFIARIVAQKQFAQPEDHYETGE